MSEKAKKHHTFPENECSKLRWIIIFLLSLLVGNFMGSILNPITGLFLPDTVRCNASFEFFRLMAAFFISFWITVFLIKKIGGTSFKSFVLGREQNSHKKETLTLMGLYFWGLLLAQLPVINHITLTNVPLRQEVLIIFTGLLFIWFHTTFEEICFRGIFARFVFGNNIKGGLSVNSVLLILMSSLTFTAGHLANPEVLHSSGIDILFTVLAYMVPGIMLMVVDLATGTLEAGIGIHWLNNLFTFLILGTEVSAGGTTSIFINHSSENTGMIALLTGIITWIPVIIYLLIKKKKTSIGQPIKNQ